MKAGKSSIAMAGLIYLLLVAIAAAGYMIYSDATRFNELSPLSASGPATRAISGIAASAGGVAAPWPSWVTSRDRETLDRARSHMSSGESRKFMTAMMVFQDELEERGHGILELKAVLISSLAGEVIASALTPVVFAGLMTMSLILMAMILGHAGANPLDALWKMVGYLMGVAGTWFLKSSLAILILILFVVAGLGMRPHVNLLYGATEAAAWVCAGLMTLWLAALTGLGAAPKPKMEKCSKCGGLGSVPKGGGGGQSGALLELGDDEVLNTMEIKPR
ncbi:MAG: hypothetical protein OEY50_09745 [Nitrospinota bacterium]|nr:hypothetical protein [Nitrospinota bacterium]MDH5679739.1 hypothetical protein [Nitrospinota bacterium]MDH5756861.1 hypothetical protein [Nitrospinota bacterium]